MDLPVRVYIHASMTKTPQDEVDFIRTQLLADQWAEFCSVIWARLRGHIIGEITITGQYVASDSFSPSELSPWFFGRYGFVVKDGVLYEKPIPCKGKLGFFRPEISEAMG